jgi:hypothetical protein
LHRTVFSLIDVPVNIFSDPHRARCNRQKGKRYKTMTTATNRFYELEQIIASGKDAYIRVGDALAEILREKLYKDAGYSTFEQYCNERWSFTRKTAYEYACAARVTHELQNEGLPAPENKRQALLIDKERKAPVQEVQDVIEVPNPSRRMKDVEPEVFDVPVEDEAALFAEFDAVDDAVPPTPDDLWNTLINAHKDAKPSRARTYAEVTDAVTDRLHYIKRAVERIEEANENWSLRYPSEMQALQEMCQKTGAYLTSVVIYKPASKSHETEAA